MLRAVWPCMAVLLGAMALAWGETPSMSDLARTLPAQQRNEGKMPTSLPSSPGPVDIASMAGAPTTAPAARATMRQMWQSSVSAPPPVDSANLDKLIKDMSTMTVRPRPKAGAIDTNVLPAQASTTQPAGQTLDATPQPASAPAPALRISLQTLEQLRKTPTSQMSDPTALADALFQDGHLDEAFNLYELASRQSDSSAESRAWRTFQMASCRRQTDPVVAGVLYRKLIADQPNCTWAPLAQAQLRLLAWTQQNNPQSYLRAAGRVTAASQPASAPASQPALARSGDSGVRP